MSNKMLNHMPLASKTPGKMANQKHLHNILNIKMTTLGL